MNYKQYYKDKIARRGINVYERNFKQKEREWERYFESTLTKHDCLINTKTAQLVFQDHSQSNNKDLSDDKYVLAKNSTIIGIGDYITWDSSEWLVFTEEHKTIKTHQQLKIKAVNEVIKWIMNGKICNNENGWGAYVQSQTLYTLGVSAGANLASVDSKMMMYMQNNEQTRTLKADDRVFIGFKVYKIKFLDPVSRPGLINYLLEEDTMSEYDNQDLAVADYYKYYGKEDVPNKEDEEEIALPEITGEDYPKISKTYTYELSNKDFETEEWSIESLGQEDNGVYVIEKDTNRLTLQFKNDNRFVGMTLNVIAKLNNGKYISKSVFISKRF